VAFLAFAVTGVLHIMKIPFMQYVHVQAAPSLVFQLYNMGTVYCVRMQTKIQLNAQDLPSITNRVQILMRVEGLCNGNFAASR